VTLNPLSHLDPIGSLMMIFVGFGWGRPVPVDPIRLGRRSSAGLMWVSLAGPLSNVLLAILGAIPVRAHWVSFTRPQPYLPSSAEFLGLFIFTNLFLALFNMIPIFPLDGEKIADSVLPPNAAQAFQAIRPIGPLILMLLLFVLPRAGIDFIDLMVAPPVLDLMSLLLG
jgi:Zn-dependent protease